MEENKEELTEVKEETKSKKGSTLYFINLIILVAVTAFFVLGLVFRIASLHYRVVYNIEGGYIRSFFNISSIFLVLAILSSIGLAVYNFIMVFVGKEASDKKRNTIYVIIAISLLTLLILIINLL